MIITFKKKKKLIFFENNVIGIEINVWKYYFLSRFGMINNAT